MKYRSGLRINDKTWKIHKKGRRQFYKRNSFRRYCMYLLLCPAIYIQHIAYGEIKRAMGRRQNTTNSFPPWGKYILCLSTTCCLLHIIDNVFGNVLLGVVHLAVIVLFHIYWFIEQQHPGISSHTERRLVVWWANTLFNPNWTWHGQMVVVIYLTRGEGWTINFNPYFNHYCIANGKIQLDDL